MALSPSLPSGYSFPDNDNVFRQNQLKLSTNPGIKAEIEKFRYKELVDGFLTEDKIEWVDTLLQCVQGYDEVNQEIIDLYKVEIGKENYERKLKSLPEISIDFEPEEKIFLYPTIFRMWAESKNICQLSKAKNGIGVRTASTQTLIHEQKQQYNENLLPKKNEGILGSFGKKPEKNGENDYE